MSVSWSSSTAEMTPLLAPVGAEVAGEGPGVDLADPDDAGLVEVAVEATGGAPRRDHRRGLADHEPGHLGTGRLDVLGVHAVVADVGIGHGDDLAGVRGVGEDLLVAAQGGVEDHLPGHLSHAAKGPSLEDRAVLEGQHRTRAHPCFRPSPIPLSSRMPELIRDGRPCHFSANRAHLREGPEPERGPAVDVLLRHRPPAPRVVAAAAVVTEDEVVSPRHVERGVVIGCRGRPGRDSPPSPRHR